MNQLDFFTHPTQKSAIVVSSLAMVAIAVLAQMSTNAFTESFDPSLPFGIAMILCLWVMLRVWANYFQQHSEKKED